MTALRYTLCGILCGLVSGIVCSLYLHALRLAIGFAAGAPYYFCLLPLVFVLCAWANKRFLAAQLPDAQGTNSLIDDYNNHNKAPELKKGPLKALLSIVTIAFGGSAGKEGPSAFLAAVVCANLARPLKLKDSEARLLLICGMAAGFASVFGTPVAATLFAVEIMVVLRLQFRALWPALLASVGATCVCRLTGVSYFHETLAVAVFDPQILLLCVLCALFAALMAVLYVFALRGFRKLYVVVPGGDYLKAFLAGLAVALCGLFLGSETLGLGQQYYEGLFLAGATTALTIPLLKILLTSLTLGWGGVGGVITPLFFIGVTAGSFFGNTVVGEHLAPVLQIEAPPATLFCAIGLVVLVAVCCRTPLAALALSIEYFGCEPLLYCVIVSALSVAATWKLSLFDAQVRFLPQNRGAAKGGF